MPKTHPRHVPEFFIRADVFLGSKCPFTFAELVEAALALDIRAYRRSDGLVMWCMPEHLGGPRLPEGTKVFKPGLNS